MITELRAEQLKGEDSYLFSLDHFATMQVRRAWPEGRDGRAELSLENLSVHRSFCPPAPCRIVDQDQGRIVEDSQAKYLP